MLFLLLISLNCAMMHLAPAIREILKLRELYISNPDIYKLNILNLQEYNSGPLRTSRFWEDKNIECRIRAETRCFIAMNFCALSGIIEGDRAIIKTWTLYGGSDLQKKQIPEQYEVVYADGVYN